MTKRAIVVQAAVAVVVSAVAAGLIASRPLHAADQVPLDTKMDASERPWHRYADWPKRDESKFNTLAEIASPPAPKTATQA